MNRGKKLTQAELMSAMQQAKYVRSSDRSLGAEYEKVGEVFYMGLMVSIWKSVYIPDDYLKTSDWYDGLWKGDAKCSRSTSR